MKLVKPQRHKQSRSKSKKVLCQVIDSLEPRMMLSATMTSQIPAATLSAGGTTQTLDLASYFEDSSIPSTDTVVEIETNLPSPYNLIPMELTTAATPITVANFLEYISNGDYHNTIIHRSIPGFVIQGGGYNTSGNMITPLGSIQGESSTEVLNNSTGTIAMALSTGPNSATSEWYFNLANNPELDNSSDGGPFTVFGKVIYQGLGVLDYIASLPVVDDTANQAWNTLPVQSGTNGATVSSEPASNYITTTPVLIPSGLVYTANTSSSSVVTASVSGDGLTLTPHAAGTASITITAEDLGLGTVTDTFNVTVNGNVQPPVVYVANASGTAGTNSTINFPVTLSNTSSSAITLDYSLTAGSAPSTDFQATAGTLTIPAGATSATIPVTLVHDSTGLPETFMLHLSSLSSNAEFASLAATETATGTINPNGAIIPTVSIANASGTAGINSQITFPVTLSSPVDSAITLDYTLTAGTAGSTDFQASGGSLTIPAGDSSASIPVDLLKDSTSAAETFAITLSGLSGNAAFATSTPTESATGTINAQATTTGLTPASTVVAIDGSDTFTATVVATATGAAASGSVTFLNGSVSIGTAELTNGVATLTANLSTAGDETFTAEYSGGGNDAASTSEAATVNVATLETSVAKSTVPTSAVAGTAVKGTTTVSLTNDTTAAEKGPVTVDIYASEDGAIDSSSVLVATVTRKETIPAGKTVSVPVVVTALTTTLPSGNYELLGESINTAGQISKSSTGPSLNLSAPVLALGETFTKLALPPSVVAGSKTTVAAVLKITNTGNIVSTGVTTIDLYASTNGTTTGANLITSVARKLSIKPGKSVSVSIPLGKYPLVANGSYTILAQVTDPKGNVTAQAFPAPVTIAAAEIDLTGAFASVPGTATIGKTISVTLDVTNSGNTTAAGLLDILFSASAASTGADPVQLAALTQHINLKPGGKITLHLKVPVASGTTAGQQYLVATIDPNDVFNSSGVTNNTTITPTAITFG
jgi:cyclophilin family peptidyl-prolyl cis-trans isomerase